MKTQVALLLATGAAAESSTANPIRKVVTLIQNLQKKVEAEAVSEEKLFNEFMCYCKNGVQTLEETISANTGKVPKVQAAIEGAEAKVKQIKAELEQHQAARKATKASSEKATALREKEAAAFAKFKSDSETNIAAIQKAVAALEKGASGSFLQAGVRSSLRKYVIDKAELADIDRDMVMAFLQGGDQYAPQSGQITGILKQMGDTMAAELKDATAEENAAVANFDGLIAANNKQIESLTAAIEKKSVRVGEVAVEVVSLKNDLKDTEKALVEDQKFLADLKKNCGTKEAEWAETCKLRSQEVIALADTIKILNSDDALELFKKTLPGSASSFMQVEVSSASTRARALSMLKAAEVNVKPAHRSLDFIALALHGNKVGFEKVIKMCDDMVALLTKEQGDDDKKKEYCDKQFDIADDKKKGLEQSISDSEKAIEDAEETIATAGDDIKALTDGVKALDKQVTEAGEQRAAENKEYKELMASDAAAKKLIGMAKDRMNKFYNPSLVGAELVSIREHDGAAPGPPPAGPKAYSKKSEESNGVLVMMDDLIKDLDKEMQVAEVDEKNAADEYKQTMSDAAAKRADDQKAITDKKAAKADAEEALQTHTDAKASGTKELAATVEYIGSLHGECDWLLQYYDVRKEARTSEIDALGKAKAVLSGADFSLLQAGHLRGRK